MLVLNPFLSGCVSVWGICNAGLLNEIFEVQKRCARIRLRLFRLEHCRYFWNMSVATHKKHLYWKKTCTGLPLWETYVIRGLVIVLSPSYSSHQLQLTAINSVRSSDVKKFKRNYFDLIMCKFTPESLRIDRTHTSQVRTHVQYNQNIEEQALGTYTRTVPLWLRYVDDTFTAVHKDGIDDFHEHLNRQNADIQFTKEIEENGKIPFLDCLVTRDNNKLKTTIYRKPTHTDRLLDQSSYNPTSHKATTIRTLTRRAQLVCDSPDSLQLYLLAV